MKKLPDEKINSFIQYYNAGMNDYEIARELKVSDSAVFRWRKSMNLPPIYERKKSQGGTIELTEENKEILCGTLLGDSSIQYYPKHGWKSPKFKCDHGDTQKEYAELLNQKLKNLGSSIKTYYRYDKRTKKTYITHNVKTIANKALFPFYYMLYSSGKKEITEEFMKNFTAKSLAYLYMDDGYFHQDSYYICTDNYSEKSVEVLINYIQKKLNIHFKKIKHGSTYRIRLSQKDIKLFNDLVSNYIIESLKYKLTVS